MHKAECDPPRGLLDVFIATFENRKDSIFRNPWIAASLDVKVEIRNPGRVEIFLRNTS